MGLDMYLNANRYLAGYNAEEAKLSREIAKLLGVPDKDENYHEDGTREWGASGNVQSIEVRAGYWRKANAIHAWFVTNVQGGEDECNPHDVSREHLTKLRDICKGLLGSLFNLIGEPDEESEEPLPEEWCAEALAALPPIGGFFFGSTYIGMGYVYDLRITVEQLDAALAMPEAWNFEYRSSW